MRTRRGKQQRAREGKVVPGRLVNYGFELNDDRTNYIVNEERMQLVRRVVHMAADGMHIHGIKRVLDAESVPTPTGGTFWHWGAIESFITDDIYKPYTFDEVREMVEPQVAAKLDSDRTYGVKWYGRNRVKWSQVSEEGPGSVGRVYRTRRKSTRKVKSEWIAIPVPDAGIPLEVVEAARRTVRNYKRGSNASGRFWELSGCVARCSLCGKAMVPRPVVNKLKSGGRSVFNYYRCSKAYGYNGRCEHTKTYKAEALEARVWELVLSLLRDPDRLRAALDKLIEEERKAHQGDPRQDSKVWMRKIAEVDGLRGRFQDMVAEALITFEELRIKLDGLEETRQTARRELDALEDRRERLAELERDKVELLESYSEKASRGLDHFTPEDRHDTYKKLRLSVLVHPGGDLEISGILKQAETLRKNVGKNVGIFRSTARRRLYLGHLLSTIGFWLSIRRPVGSAATDFGKAGSSKGEDYPTALSIAMLGFALMSMLTAEG